MFGVATSDDYQPVAWMGRYPIHVPTLLVITHVACLIATCFLLALGGGAILNLLVFDSAQVLHAGRFWQLATYAFVHSPSPMEVLWFAVEMYMLFIFGREVERFIGRRAFLALYAILLFAPPILLTLVGAWVRAGLAGSSMIHFAVFIAFAALYPNVELFLRIMAKWMALIFVAAYSLSLFAYHGWAELAVLWLSVGIAWGFIHFHSAGLEMSWLSGWTSRWRSRRALRVLPSPAQRRPGEQEDIYDTIDPVLEKISKQGIGSLTAGERRALDRARNRLLKKSK
jgi:membrane associated rhomboid family serine protease